MHGQGRNVLTYFLIVGERNTEIAVCATAELSASPHFPPPTPTLPQGALQGCQVHGQFSNFLFSMAVELFEPPLGRREVVLFCFQWAHFNTWVAWLCCTTCFLVSWCTSIFNPSHFLEAHRFQRLQEIHNSLIHSYLEASTKMKRHVFPGRMESFGSGS